MRNKLLLFSLLAAFVGLWYFFNPGDERLSAETNTRHQAAVIKPAQATIAPELLLEAGIERDFWDATVTPPSTAAPLSALNEKGENTLSIQLVDAESRQSVVGASVWTYLLSSTTVERNILHNQTSDPEHIGNLLSEEYRSGQDGYVVIPRLGARQTVVARKGPLVGIDRYYRDSDRILKLEIDREIPVKILDHLERPLPGILVGVSYQSAGHTAILSDSATMTNELGIATIAHVQYLAQKHNATSLHIQPLVLLKDPVSSPMLPWLAIGGGPIFSMPPMGSLDISAVDLEGNPLKQKFEAILREDLQPTILNEAKETSNRIYGKGRFKRISLPGIVHYPHVGLGLNLAIGINGHGVAESTNAYGQGPQTVGQTVQLIAKPWIVPTTFRLQLIDRDNTPLLNTPLSLLFADGEDWYLDAGEYTTDDVGVFTYTPTSLHLEEIINKYRGFSIRSHCAHNDFPGEGWFPVAGNPRGMQEVVEVQLTQENLAVAGTVVNEQGDPLPDLEFWALQKDRSQATEILVLTDNRGRFHVFEKNHSQEITLFIRQSPYLGIEKTFPWGATDAKIALHKGKGISGKILLPKNVLGKNISIVFIPTKKMQSNYRVKANGDGTFLLMGLPSSDGTLEIRLKEQNTLLLIIDDVLPHELSEPLDPRLAAIDLRSMLRYAEVLALNPDFQPLPEARLTKLLDGTQQARGYANPQGVFELIIPPGGLRVRIGAPGYLPQTIQAMEGKQEVQLLGGAPAILELSQAPVLPEKVEIWILPWLIDSSSGEVVMGKWESFDANGIATTKLPSAGQYGAYLSLKRGNENIGRLPSWSQWDHGQTFSVTSDGDGLHGRIEISLLEVEAVLASD